MIMNKKTRSEMRKCSSMRFIFIQHTYEEIIGIPKSKERERKCIALCFLIPAQYHKIFLSHLRFILHFNVICVKIIFEASAHDDYQLSSMSLEINFYTLSFCL